MTFPLAFAVAAFSFLNPAKYINSQNPSKKSNANNNSNNNHNNNNSIYLWIGLVTGAGLYAFLDYQIQKYRVRERLRNRLGTCMDQVRLWSLELSLSEEKEGEESEASPNENGNQHNDNENENENDVNSSSTSSSPLSVKQIPFESLPTAKTLASTGTLRILASPNIALTSSLYVGYITLPPHSKMMARPSKGVEVYYVLQGTGVLILTTTAPHTNKNINTKRPSNTNGTSGEMTQNENENNDSDGDGDGDGSGDDEIPLVINDTFVIDPWRTRCVANKGNDNLVFLRITDIGMEYKQDLKQDIVLPYNQSSTSVEIVHQWMVNGIQRMGTGAIHGMKERMRKYWIRNEETP